MNYEEITKIEPKILDVEREITLLSFPNSDQRYNYWKNAINKLIGFNAKDRRISTPYCYKIVINRFFELGLDLI